MCVCVRGEASEPCHLELRCRYLNNNGVPPPMQKVAPEQLGSHPPLDLDDPSQHLVPELLLQTSLLAVTHEHLNSKQSGQERQSINKHKTHY